MVAGHLQEKSGIYYMVLTYPDLSGKRKTKWISTKLPVKGNKKKIRTCTWCLRTVSFSYSMEGAAMVCQDENCLENKRLGMELVN